MSRIFPRIKDRLDAWANPVLVREMYQSVHNKKFLGAIWILLLASLFTYVIVFVNNASGTACGDSMFVAFSVFIYLVAVVVLPYLAYSNLQEEVKTGTLELIHITRLHSRKQIRGRLFAAMVKVGLLYSVIGPFAVAAFLFKGIGVAAVLTVLYELLVFSAVAVAVGLFFASLTAVPYLKSISRFVYLAALVGTLLLIVGFLEMMEWHLRGDFFSGSGELITYLFGLTFLGGLGAWFFCAGSANILTFEAAKSSALTKLILLGGVVTLAGIVFLFHVTTGSTTGELFVGLQAMAMPAVSLCCLVWMTDKRHVPYRMQQKLGRRGLLYRLLLYPFSDGVGASAVFFGLVCAAVVGWGLLAASTGTYRSEYFLPVTVCFVYVLYFSALVRLFSLVLPKRFRKPSVWRGCLLVLVIGQALIGLLWVSLASWSASNIGGDNPLVGLFPLVYMFSGDLDSVALAEVFWSLSLAGILGVIVHIVIVVRELPSFILCDFSE